MEARLWEAGGVAGGPLDLAEAPGALCVSTAPPGVYSRSGTF